MTRDSAFWIVLMVSGVLTFLLGHFGLLQDAFPSLGPSWEARIELAAGCLSVIAGVLRMSPLPISPDGREKAIARDVDREMRRLPAILLVMLLGAGVVSCASAGGPLVAADRAVHAAVAQTQDTADRLCDRQILTPAACQQLNADLVPVIESADAFNRAVRANSSAEVPAMIGALDRFARALEPLVPDATERAAIQAQVAAALAQLRALVGR
jgi:hypothetical protein